MSEVFSEYNSLTDEQLILMVRQNDDGAYAALLARYTPVISKLVHKYSDSFDRDDLFQEASIAFYYAIQFFDFQSASFATFTSVCVERSLISAINKNNAKKRIPSELIVPLDEELEGSDNPLNMLIEKEAHRLVSKEIASRLSEFELSVLKSFLATESYDETAAALAVSRKSVDNALSRVRRKLDSLK